MTLEVDWLHPQTQKPALTLAYQADMEQLPASTMVERVYDNQNDFFHLNESFMEEYKQLYLPTLALSAVPILVETPRASSAISWASCTKPASWLSWASNDGGTHVQDKPLEKKSQSPLYQQLMARLKNDILAGVYPSGARIPSEQLLCETYGVSRVTVRKAMLDLVQEGLLVRRQGKGTFVADERIQRDPAANHQLFGGLPPERALCRHQSDQRRAGGSLSGGRRAPWRGARRTGGGDLPPAPV